MYKPGLQTSTHTTARDTALPARDALADGGGQFFVAALVLLGMLAWAGLMVLGTLFVVSDVVLIL